MAGEKAAAAARIAELKADFDFEAAANGTWHTAAEIAGIIDELDTLVTAIDEA